MQFEEVCVDLEKFVYENIYVLVVVNKMDFNFYIKKEYYFLENSIVDYYWVFVFVFNKMNIDYFKESLYDVVFLKKINLESIIVVNVCYYEVL